MVDIDEIASISVYTVLVNKNNSFTGKTAASSSDNSQKAAMLMALGLDFADDIDDDVDLASSLASSFVSSDHSVASNLEQDQEDLDDGANID